MFRFARALALPLALTLAAAPVFAADNWTVKDSTGATVVLRSKDTGSGQAQYHILADGTGLAYSSANPVPSAILGTLPAFAVTPTFNLGTAPSLTIGTLPALATGSNTIGSLANISGTISLPTGAATSALQTTANTSLGTIATNSGTQATAAAQATGNTSLASIDAKTPALAALPTLANQTAGNASLASLDIKATANNAKLDALIGQSPPTSLPGTSLGSSIQVPSFQGVTGGVPLGANILLGGVAPSFASPLPVGQSVGGAAIGPNNPMPIDTVIKGGGTDVGGAITTASTAQTFMAANPTRRAWSLQNQSAGDLYVNCSTTATLDYHSLKIPAGALYESAITHVGTGACSIIGATAGAGFYARQF